MPKAKRFFVGKGSLVYERTEKYPFPEPVGSFSQRKHAVIFRDVMNERWEAEQVWLAAEKEFAEQPVGKTVVCDSAGTLRACDVCCGHSKPHPWKSTLGCDCLEKICGGRPVKCELVESKPKPKCGNDGSK